MVILTEEQFQKICPKEYKLAQCEWFRNKYNTTLIIRNQRYCLEFKTAKEETFFRVKYADYL